METLEKLKERISFQQTDEFCLNFLNEIAGRGIITINDGDLTVENGVNMVSDRLFLQCCAAWGVDPDGDDVVEVIEEA